MHSGIVQVGCQSTISFGHSHSKPGIIKHLPLKLGSASRLLTRPRASHKATFHSGETAVSVPLPTEAALALGSSLDIVLDTFRKKETSKPQRWESMEFRYSKDDINIEFFCNPNAYADAFKAKVLFTISDGNMNVTSEALLSAIKSDVEHFIEMYI